MKSVMLSVLLLLTLACSTAHSKVPPSVSNSVFVLQVEGSSICTAFVVETPAHQKRLISAGHCAARINDSSSVIALHPVLGSYPLHLLEFKNDWPEDYSIFEFSQLAPNSALTIRDTLPEVGDETWALIAPLTINPFFVPGYYSGLVSCSEGEGTCEPDKMYLAASPIGPGASGAPIMDSRGRVFGIMVGSHPSLSGMAVVAALPKL